MTDASPKDAARKLGLSPAVPAAWTPGDAKKMSAGEAQAALQPKSFQPAVDAVSPDGMFAAVTNYEDKDDELGAMVFLRKGNKGWRRLGQDRQGVFLSGPRFSPDGSLLACQYQTDGYDGPEPWALVSTKSGVDLLAAARPASKGLLPFALAVKTDALAVGWSDGSVTVQRLDRLER